MPPCKNILLLEKKLKVHLRPYLKTLYAKTHMHCMLLGLPPSVNSKIELIDIVDFEKIQHVETNVRWQWIFSVVRNQKIIKPYRPMLQPNIFVAGCIWKGFLTVNRRIPNVESVLYDTDFENAEGKTICLLQMARNRPKGTNVFAQLNKDVLNKIIVPMVKFTLPFEI